jgi:lipopolysaccharide heptosyltransferase II
MSVPSLVGPTLPRVNNILVVHLRGGLGDVLMSTPVLEALAHRYPQAKIDMMVRATAAPLVRHHPAIHNLLVMREGDLEQRRVFLHWTRKLTQRKYRLGLVLWSKFPEALMLKSAKVRFRVGQDSRVMYSWMYTHRVRVRSEHGDESSHWVECLLDYARAVGADLDHPQPRFYLDDEARNECTRLLKQRGLEGGEPLAVLHVGRGTPQLHERMPTMPFSKIADALAEELGVPVLLTGSESERALVEKVAAGCKRRVEPLIGVLTLQQLGALLERASLVVANDSGPMHMAAAVGAPTVGIFAMEKDLPQRWGPLGTGNQVVRPEHFQCSESCLKETCQRMKCYEDITPGMVIDAARRALDARTATAQR